MNKLLLISLGIILIAVLIIFNIDTQEVELDDDDSNSEIEFSVENPKTGEKWDSIEEYIYRDLNSEVKNNGS